MRSEMIERMARAICTSCGGNPDRMAFTGFPEYGPRNAFIYVPDDESWQKPRPLWQFFTSEASAALQAMREPSNAMIEAACQTDRDTDQYCATGEEHWKSMIDEALK